MISIFKRMSLHHQSIFQSRQKKLNFEMETKIWNLLSKVGSGVISWCQVRNDTTYVTCTTYGPTIICRHCSNLAREPKSMVRNVNSPRRFVIWNYSLSGKRQNSFDQIGRGPKSDEAINLFREIYVRFFRLKVTGYSFCFSMLQSENSFLVRFVNSRPDIIVTEN